MQIVSHCGLLTLPAVRRWHHVTGQARPALPGMENALLPDLIFNIIAGKSNLPSQCP
jgi:hypothetical protein